MSSSLLQAGISFHESTGEIPEAVGRSHWKGAEVTVGEKLLIRDFEQLTYQLPQAGTLLLFSKSGTEYQHLYALISFPGKVTEDNQYI